MYKDGEYENIESNKTCELKDMKKIYEKYEICAMYEAKPTRN